jgi:hypothetical protein
MIHAGRNRISMAFSKHGHGRLRRPACDLDLNSRSTCDSRHPSRNSSIARHWSSPGKSSGRSPSSTLDDTGCGGCCAKTARALPGTAIASARRSRARSACSGLSRPSPSGSSRPDQDRTATDPLGRTPRKGPVPGTGPEPRSTRNASRTWSRGARRSRFTGVCHCGTRIAGMPIAAPSPPYQAMGSSSGLKSAAW